MYMYLYNYYVCRDPNQTKKSLGYLEALGVPKCIDCGDECDHRSRKHGAAA